MTLFTPKDRGPLFFDEPLAARLWERPFQEAPLKASPRSGERRENINWCSQLAAKKRSLKGDFWAEPWGVAGLMMMARKAMIETSCGLGDQGGILITPKMFVKIFFSQFRLLGQQN